MPWTTSERGLFYDLPPQLPESVRSLAAQFTEFVEQSKTLGSQAGEMRQKRDQVRRDYEEALADAMRKRRKQQPVNPLPDYDQAVEALDLRRGASLRAAAQVYAEIGAALLASKTEDITAVAAELDGHLRRAEDQLTELRPTLEQVTSTLARLHWHSELTGHARPYRKVTSESRIVEDALGQLLSVVRRLAHELAQMRERDQKREEERAAQLAEEVAS